MSNPGSLLALMVLAIAGFIGALSLSGIEPVISDRELESMLLNTSPCVRYELSREQAPLTYRVVDRVKASCMFTPERVSAHP
ncbi:hypothetical protein [Dolichospermum phage Dfl-JY45]